MDDLAVTYRKIKGYHVLTSPDVDGLYTMSRDFKQAVKSAEEAIPILLNENKDLAVKAAAWDRSKAGSFEPQVEDTPNWSAPEAGQQLFFHVVPMAAQPQVRAI